MTRDAWPTEPEARRSETRRGVLVGLAGIVGPGSLAGLGTDGAGTVSARSGDDVAVRAAADPSDESAIADAVQADGADDVDPTDDGAIPDPDELERFVDDRVRRRIGTETPGATVAVVRGEEPLLAKGYGAADTETREPVRAGQTAFRVGSVGKLVTWTAVMQCVERGLLDLDEDVTAYLGSSPVTVPETYEAPVTLRHLGTHTAGFESSLDPGVVDSPDAVAPLETVLVRDRPRRVRPPGELVGYSNYGAALAGHVVAEVADRSFEAFVQSEVFDPLGMSHSTFAQPVPDEHAGRLAAGHVREGTSFAPGPEVYFDMRPAGSLSTTAEDVARFASAHLNAGAVGDARILAPDTVATMHDTHHVRHPAVTNWRYGFHEYGDPDGDLVGHSGATIHFTSQLVLALDHDVGVFVAYDTNGSEPPSVLVDEILAELDLLPAPTGSSPAPDGASSTPSVASSTPSVASSTPTTESGVRERADAVAGEYSATYLPDSGPLHAMDVAEHVRVDAAGVGRLRTSTLSGDVRHWIETEPYVYRELGGRGVLAVETEAGAVTAAHFASEPTGAYLPVPAHERQLVSAGVVGGSLAGFGLSLAGRTALGAWRRWGPGAPTDEERTVGPEGDR